jgi:hypothetical protein
MVAVFDQQMVDRLPGRMVGDAVCGPAWLLQLADVFCRGHSVDELSGGMSERTVPRRGVESSGKAGRHGPPSPATDVSTSASSGSESEDDDDVASTSEADDGPTRAKKTTSLKKQLSCGTTGSQAEYFRPEETIILFDWDDTLCPSHWIRANKPALGFHTPAPQEELYQVPLRKLEGAVYALLELALKLGRVAIVTNASEPWVLTSAKNFMPRLVPLVQAIPCLYARSIAGSGGIYSDLPPQRWKEVAFQQEIDGFYSRYEHQSWKNVISIGDSTFERDAVRYVVLGRETTAQKRCRTKTTKMLDAPTIDELIAQVRIVHDALAMMVQHDGNLEIEIDAADLSVDLSLVEKLADAQR